MKSAKALLFSLLMIVSSLAGCFGNDMAPTDDSDGLKFYFFEASEPFGNELGVNENDGEINLKFTEGNEIAYSELILEISGNNYPECDGTQENGVNCWDRSDNDETWGLNHNIWIYTTFERNYSLTIIIKEFGEEPYGNKMLGQTTYTHIFDDEDDDGVIDSEDSCPSTPAGEQISMTGCSQSQLDDDSDGVVNSDDQCPETTAGETVDTFGCAHSQLDDDNDGVANQDDRCLETIAGEAVDTFGCAHSQLDDDNDGVANQDDQCPETPLFTQVDADGCADSQLDDDSDGVMNSDDQCPETPLFTQVDAEGCADSQLDDDSDGVMNSDDQCPETTAGETVDTNGCAQSQLDDDSDGVVNSDDLCPNTNIADRNNVNANGCSDNQLDDDNDGVSNRNDLCPNTLEGTQVNYEGCIDSDGDGVRDSEDSFPNDATEFRDRDNDGIGDNADLDDSGNGVSWVKVDQIGMFAHPDREYDDGGWWSSTDPDLFMVINIVLDCNGDPSTNQIDYQFSTDTYEDTNEVEFADEEFSFDINDDTAQICILVELYDEDDGDDEELDYSTGPDKWHWVVFETSSFQSPEENSIPQTIQELNIDNESGLVGDWTFRLTLYFD